MTRHRRGDTGGADEDAPPWRDQDYDRTSSDTGSHGYFPSSWDDVQEERRPRRAALDTSTGRDEGPGEATGPPWDMPGWDDSQPPRRTRRPNGLTGSHPSGPLPRVSPSDPLPPVSPSGPLPPVSPPGPLPPVPADSWPSGGTDSGYPPDPYLDGPGAHDTGGHPRLADHEAPYLRTGLTDPGYNAGHRRDGDYQGGDDRGYAGSAFADPPAGFADPPTGFADPSAGPGYGGPSHDSGYGDLPAGSGGYPDLTAGSGGYAGPGPGQGGYPREDYGDEPGYPAGGGPGYPPGGYEHASEDYATGAGYGSGYPTDDGYPDDRYAPDDGYGQGGAYPQAGYPDVQDAGYPAETEYSPAGGPPERGITPGRPRDHDDDRGYGQPGDWYGDVDEDQSWAEDDGYNSGILPGLGGSGGADSPRGRGSVPRVERTGPPGGRAGGGRPRGGNGKGRKSPMRRAAPWIALSVLVMVLLAVGGVGFYYYRTYLHPPDFSGPGTGTVTVHIEQGETATQVGQQLVGLGVVASVRAFSNAAKNSGHGSSLEPGVYQLHKHMSAALAFGLLLKPSSKVVDKITIPEGLRLYEVIDLLGKATGNLKGYQQAIKDIAALGLPSYANGNPEGYLFPDTYTIQPGTPPIQVLKEMVHTYIKQVAGLNLAAASAKDQVSESDIIKTASIVQAEGQRPQDLPKVARVIYNRLNDGMRLQLDSTVLYALHSRAGDVTIAQTTHTKSPYNTYLHNGLPPGPIDSPGAAAIKAAMHPQKGTWTYFLTVNPKTGLTKFTASYTVFLNYVAELNAYNASHH